MTTVLKLGGSVLTVKDERETVDRTNLARAADAIGELYDAGPPRSGTVHPLVIVHGGGSFGHPAADRHGVSPSTGTHDADSIREIHAAMGRLNGAVLEALAERGVPALPVRPLSAATRDDADELALAPGPVRAMVQEGFVPVLHGDVIAHRGRGATIVSGDELVVAVARAVDAGRVGLCTASPGVRGADGSIIDRIDAFADVEDAFEPEGPTDVTGGMAGKVRTLLSLETPASIFALDGLAPFLAGETPGTTIC